MFPALANAPPATLERIARGGAYRKAPAGTPMFDGASPCSGFPLVLAGSIRVLQRYPNGRELQLYRVEPGESCILTASCLLGNAAYNAPASPKPTSTCWCCPRAVPALIAEDEPFRSHVFSCSANGSAS